MIEITTRTIGGQVVERYPIPQYHKSRRHRKGTRGNIPRRKELPSDLKKAGDSLVHIAYGDLDPQRWSKPIYRYTPFQFLVAGEVCAQDMLDYIIDSFEGTIYDPFLQCEPGFVLYVLPFQDNILEVDSAFGAEREPGLEVKLCLGESPIAIFGRQNATCTRWADDACSQKVTEMTFADGSVYKVDKEISQYWGSERRKGMIQNIFRSLMEDNGLVTGFSSRRLYDAETVLKTHYPKLADLEFKN